MLNILYRFSLIIQILIFTRWAIDGIVCFCSTVVGLNNAPVATNRMLRYRLPHRFLRICPHNTEAQHPHPDPPA